VEDFNKLYEMYSKQIYKYLLYLTGDSNSAEELLQETFYQAFKSIYRFKGNSKVSTWLYQIAKHVYFKHVKKQSRERPGYLEEGGEIADYLTPEKISVEKERSSELIRSIHKLKEPYKEVITLRTYSELSFKDIGEILEQSEGWARTTYYRGKLQLKEMLIQNRWEE
jgi:RNA polymerase sigma-70 factor, ECF subfamily